VGDERRPDLPSHHLAADAVDRLVGLDHVRIARHRLRDEDRRRVAPLEALDEVDVALADQAFDPALGDDRQMSHLVQAHQADRLRQCLSRVDQDEDARHVALDGQGESAHGLHLHLPLDTRSGAPCLYVRVRKARRSGS
jgi:hypothetical protein